MQFLKDEVRQSIEQIALIEFKTKGFKGASIRSIAKNSGTSVGNLYKYFQSKEDLYESLIGTVYHYSMDCIAQFSKVNFNKEPEKLFFDLMKNILQLIETNSTELSILLNKSEGSKYESCKGSFINIITEIVTASTKTQLLKKNMILQDNFMIHLLSTNLVDSIAVILNSKNNQEEIRNLILSLIEVLYGDLENKLPGIVLMEDEKN